MNFSRAFLVLFPRYALVTVLILFSTSMFFYPGGTIINPNSSGHDFYRNFLSDLGKYSLENQVSMILFAFALLIVGIVFCGHFYHFMKLYKMKNSLGWSSRIAGFFGIFGSICFTGVGFTPHNILIEPHLFFVNWAFRAFLLSSIFMSYTLFRDKRYLSRYAVGYVIFTLQIFLYILVLEFGPDPKGSDSALIFSVVAQKVIILVFMLSVLFQSFGNSKLIITK